MLPSLGTGLLQYGSGSTTLGFLQEQAFIVIDIRARRFLGSETCVLTIVTKREERGKDSLLKQHRERSAM
jgi:hypothetical protein